MIIILTIYDICVKVIKVKAVLNSIHDTQEIDKKTK